MAANMVNIVAPYQSTLGELGHDPLHEGHILYMKDGVERPHNAATSTVQPPCDRSPQRGTRHAIGGDSGGFILLGLFLVWRLLIALARGAALLCAIIFAWCELTHFLVNLYAPIACANSGQNPWLYCRELGLWMLTGEAWMSAMLLVFALLILVWRRSLPVRILSFVALGLAGGWLYDTVGHTYDYLWPMIFRNYREYPPA